MNEIEYIGPWLPKWLSFLSGVPEDRRRRRTLVVIQAYVDDSGGKGQGEVFVFSALIASAEMWAGVVDRWNFVLRESPSVRYFKMGEAAGCRGEFYGFLASERDEKLRRLCAIINTPEISEFSCTLVLADFLEFWAPRLGRPASEPYFFPFQVINSAMGAEMLGRGETQPCEIFFDEHVMFGPRAKAWYPVLRESFPANFKNLMPVEPFFRSDRDVIALQAADLTAWMQRNANESGLGEFDWLWQTLQLMRHSPLSLVVDRDFINRMVGHKQSPEEIERNALVLSSYREIFGHEWPPKTKQQFKRHGGR
jgi:hypothetical protein